MPPLGEALGARGTSEVAVYVRSLSGQQGDPVLAAAGAKHYAMLCVACHGADGKGNPALGAPDLTDATWLHGGSFKDVSDSVRLGRIGTMPAHGPLIGEARARLAAAYVLSRAGEADARPPGAGAHPE
jgi:cytochrome c oxidase cbb3-type subunit 3